MLSTDTVTFVNFVTDTRVIPEFIGKNCRADLIAPALLESLIAPQGQLRALRDTMDKPGMGAPSPGTQAAGSVIRFLNGTQRAGKASWLLVNPVSDIGKVIACSGCWICVIDRIARAPVFIKSTSSCEKPIRAMQPILLQNV